MVGWGTGARSAVQRAGKDSGGLRAVGGAGGRRAAGRQERRPTMTACPQRNRGDNVRGTFLERHLSTRHSILLLSLLRRTEAGTHYKAPRAGGAERGREGGGEDAVVLRPAGWLAGSLPLTGRTATAVAATCYTLICVLKCLPPVLPLLLLSLPLAPSGRRLAVGPVSEACHVLVTPGERHPPPRVLVVPLCRAPVLAQQRHVLRRAGLGEGVQARLPS